MRDQRRRRLCIQCERPVEECGSLSTRGKCRDCAEANMVAQFESAVDQVTSAEWLRRWRAGMAASIGASLPEGWTSD